MRQITSKILLICCLIVPGTTKAAMAGGQPVLNADSLFLEARELAFAGDCAGSRRVCFIIIDRYPGYIDAYLLAGRTFAWEEKTDSARQWIGRALEQDPGYPDAIAALVQTETWAGTARNALPAVEKGLELHPGNPGLLFLKALTHSRAGELKALRRTLFLLEDTVPGYPGADSLRQASRLLHFPRSLGIDYRYDHFSLPYIRNWHVVSLSADGGIRNSTFSLRLNNGYLAGEGNAFSENLENQFETDWYPRLGEKSYFYLNAGISPGKFFPRYRTGAEFFMGLPHDWVASAGFRYLKWDRDFLFYTLSAEKYAGRYWLSLRPYLFHKPYGWSSAWFITARRYLGGSENYLQLIAGTGTSPDEPLLAATDLERLHSRIIRAGGQFMLGPHWRVQFLAGYSREDYSETNQRNRLDFQTGLRYKF